MASLRSILSGKEKELKTQESCLIQRFHSYELKEACDKGDKKFDPNGQQSLRFAMDNFETELVVMGIKLAPTQYELPIPS